MIKGLEALKHLEDRANHDEYLFREDTNREKAVAFLEDNKSYVSTIEHELKEYNQLREELNTALNLNQCQTVDEWIEMMQNKLKLLNAFKNALTLEYHEYPTVEFNPSEDNVSYFVKQLYTIKQNEMDRDIRNNLREWVLKNAFPKELEALAIIKAINLFRVYESIEGKYYLETNIIDMELMKENYDTLREVLK